MRYLKIKEGINDKYLFKAMFLVGGGGSGKCLGKDTPIIMYDGTIKNIQDVVVSDYLMGIDGSKREVIAIHNGKDEMFKVSPVKGNSFNCAGKNTIRI